MIEGSLNKPETYNELLRNDTWRLVFEWAEKVPSPDDGEHLLRGRDVRAIVTRARGKERSQGAFEAHQREVDLHLCLEGSELVEYAPVPSLAANGPYDPDKDVTLFAVPAQSAVKPLVLSSKDFVIFFPEDGHMPGIRTQDEAFRKIVFKVPYTDVK